MSVGYLHTECPNMEWFHLHNKGQDNGCPFVLLQDEKVEDLCYLGEMEAMEEKGGKACQEQ